METGIQYGSSQNCLLWKSILRKEQVTIQSTYHLSDKQFKPLLRFMVDNLSGLLTIESVEMNDAGQKIGVLPIIVFQTESIVYQTAKEENIKSLLYDFITGGNSFYQSPEILKEVKEKFHEIWKRYVGVSLLFKPVPATPFYHLCYEPFWKLYADDGTPVDRLTTTPSLGYIRSNGIRAAIDKNLFELMKSPDCRARMRTLLISTYLTRRNPKIIKTIPIVVGIMARLYV